MRPAATACHAAWWVSCLPGLIRFRRALQRPEHVQRRILEGYLRGNANTAFGRRYRFDHIRSPAEFRNAVPLTTFEDYVPYVDRIAAGEPNVLTRKPVRVLEPSSGSISAAKRIPYTDSLRREFARGLAPWVASLFRSDPALAAGPAYWSITPRARADGAKPSAVPVGFEDDTAYLGGPLRRMLDATLAVPAEVGLLSDLEPFRYVTGLMMLQARELSLISVWHPSYLSLLLDSIRRHWDPLLVDLRGGTLRPPGSVEPSLLARLSRRFRPDPHRADELDAAGKHLASRFWPRLRLISCWAGGHAALAAEEIEREFPGVRMQPKGLLATEAFVSLPWRDGHALAVRSHFFEFLTDDGDCRLAHELDPGGTYSVVVTTGGGLYRYRLEDRVRVTGFAGATPMLQFLGKEDHVSDRCGEKLHAAFVADALRRILAGRRASFAMLAPDPDGRTAGYTLYVEASGGRGCGDLAPPLEAALRESFHYRECAELGQLRPARVFRISGGAFEAYARRSVGQGRRLGDLKPDPLSIHSGWSKWFEGEYVDTTGRATS